VTQAVGVDVSASRLYAVAVDVRKRVLDAAVFSAEEPAQLVEWAEGADAVAIDAPAQTSSAPHVGDTTLSPKFRLARCAEIALGREHGIWVPWVAPARAPSEGWIAAGLRAFAALDVAGIRTLEVFPHAGFRLLAGSPLPRKTAPEGRLARVSLLQRIGVRERSLALWSHDGLDALVGALVALDAVNGSARRATCGHDGSAIWLPASS
jgi:predicted nuclease with RNAse H fold